jgi:hypothetical protein
MRWKQNQEPVGLSRKNSNSRQEITLLQSGNAAARFQRLYGSGENLWDFVDSFSPKVRVPELKVIISMYYSAHTALHVLGKRRATTEVIHEIGFPGWPELNLD